MLVAEQLTPSEIDQSFAEITNDLSILAERAFPNTIPEEVEVEAVRVADELVRSVGRAAVNLEASTNEEPRSLLTISREAAKGDPAKRKVVWMSGMTDVIERIFKSGHIIEVPIEFDANGDASQYGERMDHIYRNSLKFNTNLHMYERSVIEARNGARLRELRKREYLEDHYFVVFSLVDDAMTIPELRQAGFFVDTMSCSIQVTSSNTVESAFVSGVSGGRQIDIDAVVNAAELLGYDFSNMTTSQILDTPLLIPKSMMPHGVSDIVALYDQKFSTFFGEEKPAQDYEAYRAFCRKRCAEYNVLADMITDRFMSRIDGLQTELDAVALLDEISADVVREHAVQDHRIDLRIFGDRAAGYMQQARLYAELGLYDQLTNSLNLAKKYDQSSSCPSGARPQTGEDKEGDSATATQENSTSEEMDGGPCDYVHDGCYCCPYNDDGTKRTKPLKVRARRDARGKATCLRQGCGAWLSADGKDGDIGGIARKAAERQRQTLQIADFALAS